MITTRAAQIKLALEYEAKTTAAREEFEVIGKQIAETISKNSDLLVANEKLRLDNKNVEIEISNNNSKLNKLMADIGQSSLFFEELNTKIQKLSVYVTSLNNKIGGLELRTKDNQALFNSESLRLNNLILQNKQYEKINGELICKNEETDNEIFKKNKQVLNRELQIADIVSKLKVEIEKNTEEKVKIEEAKNRLNKIAEKLNKHYIENNIDNNINIWEEAL